MNQIRINIHAWHDFDDSQEAKNKNLTRNWLKSKFYSKNVRYEFWAGKVEIQMFEFLNSDQPGSAADSHNGFFPSIGQFLTKLSVWSLINLILFYNFDLIDLIQSSREVNPIMVSFLHFDLEL